MVQRLTKANSIGFVEPLGLLSIAEYVRSLGYCVEVFAGDVYGGRAAVERSRKDSPAVRHVVGLYCDYENMNAVASLTRELKQLHPVHVFVGGPQCVGLGEEFLRESGADGLFRGEGEYAVGEILSRLDQDRDADLAGITGLCLLRHNRFIDSGINPPLRSLDSLPPISGEISALGKRTPNSMAVLTGRGCPFRCAFCYEGENGKTVRTRSVDHVMRELRLRLGNNPAVRYIFFGDDTFTLDLDRVDAFCRELTALRREHDFVWFADGHVNIIKKNPEMVRRMVAAGLVRMQIGIESCCQPIIDIYKKNIRKEDFFTVIDVCKEAGLPQLVGNVIIGGALETRDTLRETFDTVQAMYDRAGLMLEVSSTLYMPFPLTEMSADPGRFGLTVIDGEGLTSSGDYPTVSTTGLTPEEICIWKRDFFDAMRRKMREMLDAEKLTDSELIAYYRLGKYGIQGMWDAYALSGRPYLHAQYKSRAVRGTRLIRECREDELFAMRPRRVMALCLSEGFCREIPALSGFVFSPVEERLLTLCSGKLTIAEICDRMAERYPAALGDRQAVARFVTDTLHTLEDKGFIALHPRLDTLEPIAVREDGKERKTVLLFHIDARNADAAGAFDQSVPLGVFVLAGWLDRQGYDARASDCRVEDLPELLASVDLSGVLAVGLSVDHENTLLAEKMSRAIVESYSIPVVIGGPEALSLEEDFLHRSRARAIVTGEGEIALATVLGRLERGESFDGVPGVRYLDRDGVYRDNGPGTVVENLDDIPFPAYHKSIRPLSFQQVYVMAGRGCPYACVFCHEGSLTRPVRRRSVTNVIAEMRDLMEKHPHLDFFRFCDDTLVSDPEWLREFCAAAAELRRDFLFDWYCEADVSTLDRHPELLPLMVASGLKHLQVGIESADAEMIRLYRKPLTAGMVERVVKNAYDSGVPVVFGAFLLGGPFENRDHIEANKRFAEKLFRLAPGVMQLAPSIVNPYPMTEIARSPEKFGLTIADPAGETSISDYPVMASEKMSIREILAVYSEYLRFFVDVIGAMLNDGTMTHEAILRSFVAAEKGWSRYWKEMIVHHRPRLHSFYTFLAKGAARRVEDVDREALPQWRPQRMVEMWHDVDFQDGFPRLFGEALSPFEFEVIKYSTGKLTIAALAERLYPVFGERAGESREEFSDRVIGQLTDLSHKYLVLVVPY